MTYHIYYYSCSCCFVDRLSPNLIITSGALLVFPRQSGLCSLYEWRSLRRCPGCQIDAAEQQTSS